MCRTDLRGLRYAFSFGRVELVNGTRELRAKDGIRAIEEAAKDPSGRIKISFESKAENGVSLGVKITKLPALSSGDRAIVTVAVIEDDLSSNVLAGENSGRKLNHMAVVRALRSIGESSGDETTLSADLTLEKNWKRDDLSVVAFVQEAQSRRVLASARIELKH